MNKREQVLQFAQQAGISAEDATAFMNDFGINDALVYYSHLPLAALALQDLEKKAKSLLTSVTGEPERMSMSRKRGSRKSGNRNFRSVEGLIIKREEE